MANKKFSLKTVFEVAAAVTYPLLALDATAGVLAVGTAYDCVKKALTK